MSAQRLGVVEIKDYTLIGLQPGLAIKQTPMIDLDDIDHPNSIINSITHTPIADADPPNIFSPYFQATRRMRVLGESLDGGNNSILYGSV